MDPITFVTQYPVYSFIGAYIAIGIALPLYYGKTSKNDSWSDFISQTLSWPYLLLFASMFRIV